MDTPEPKDSKEFAKEYLSSLVDLTYNSKPLIDMLTILAEENIEHGQVIVDAVEQHIAKVVTEHKLPVLYLIDSIVKNVGGEYTALFSHSIVNIFCGVFEKVNEKVRQKMFSLRQTWNEVFTQQKLYALDLKVKTIDSAWPITAKVAPAIHVNPNFLKNQKQHKTLPEKDLQAQLLDKKLELLKLESRKIELELASKLAMQKEKQNAIVVNMQAEIEPCFSPSPSSPPPAEPIVVRPTTHPMLLNNNHNPNRVRVAPVSAAMLATHRDPRLKRMQQTVTQSLPPPIPAALTMPLYGGPAQHVLNGNAVAPFGQQQHQQHHMQQQQTHTAIQEQIMAEIEKQVGRPPIRDTSSNKQRIAHNNRSKSSNSGNNRGSNSSKSSNSNHSDNHRSKSSSSRSSAKNNSSKSSSGRESRSDRGSGRNSDYKSSSRRSNDDHHNKKSRTTSTSSNSPGKKSSHSPKRSSRSPAKFNGHSDHSQEQQKHHPQQNSHEGLFGGPLSDPQLVAETKQFSESNALLLESINVDDIDSRMVMEIASMKRSSDEGNETEPHNKKTKAEKIDALFGSEDVDLRQINPIMHRPQTSLGSATSDSDSAITDPSSNKLDAIRAKIAASAANRQMNNRAVIHLDHDMRPRSQVEVGFVAEPSAEGTVDEVSAAADDDSNYQQLVAHAQLQLEQQLITIDQYNQTIAQLRAQHKSVANLKRKHDKLPGQNNNHNPFNGRHSSTSDEDAEQSSTSEHEYVNGSRPKRDRPSNATNGSDGVATTNKSNSRRNRSHRQRKSKWSDHVSTSAPVVPHGGVVLPPPTFDMPMSGPMVGGMWPPPAPLAGPPGVVLAAPHHQQAMPPMMWQAPPPNLLAPGMAPQQPQMIGPIQPAFVPVASMDYAQQQQPQNESDNPFLVHSINIDGVSRDIRYYGETAIAFMDDAPRELGFNAGERIVRINGVDAARLVFNHDYVPVNIDGLVYQVRFGTPMRELYINGVWFECLFGEATYITLSDGLRHCFEVEGPSPQVRIGALRRDLCAGRVDLYIDSTCKKTFFLDAQEQPFELDGHLHMLRFHDFFLTVLIDGQPFTNVQYGGMPKRFRIGARDRFIRFSVLPDGLVAGKVYVKNMPRSERNRNMPSPPPTVEPVMPPATTMPLGFVDDLNGAPAPFGMPTNFANILGGVGAPANVAQPPPVAAPSVDGLASVAPLNINDLLQKLVASGIIESGSGKSNDSPPPAAAAAAKPAKNGKKSPPSFPPAEPIDFRRPETIKKRQQANVQALFAGMQCSSCGVRFPSDQNVKYGEHLDWHFRQNRRDRDLARRAHSRRWYFDVADWVQYEDGVEETERSWYEAQQADLGADCGPSMDDDSASRGAEALPSCAAESDDVDKTCDMCHDRFETFYNEETEDWHLRNAVREGTGTFHPICLKDYQASLTLDESAMRADLDGDNAVDFAMKQQQDDEDDDDDVIVMPADEPSIMEIHDEVAENNDETVSSSDRAADDSQSESKLPKPIMSYESIGNESDLQILVPQISVLDVDAIDEEQHSSAERDAAAFPVKIKEEPRKGYRDELDEEAEEEEDDGFEEVGTIESAAIDDQSADAVLHEILDSTSGPATPIAASAAAADAETSSVGAPESPSAAPGTPATPLAIDENEPGLDGNDEPAVATAPTSTNNKIKINITMNVSNKAIINSSENTEKQPTHQQHLATPSTTDDKLTNGECTGIEGGEWPPFSGPGATADDGQTRPAFDAFSEDSMSRDAFAAAPEPPTVEAEPDFEFKESMRGLHFERMEIVRSGHDASGLCSIM